jgi:hypothetical protein
MPSPSSGDQAVRTNLIKVGSAQGMDVAAIAKVAFTSEDRVRDVIRNFNADGFNSLYPQYKGGDPLKFTLGQRRETKKIATSPASRARPALLSPEPGETGGLPRRGSSWQAAPMGGDGPTLKLRLRPSAASDGPD